MDNDTYFFRLLKGLKKKVCAKHPDTGLVFSRCPKMVTIRWRKRRRYREEEAGRGEARGSFSHVSTFHGDDMQETLPGR